MHGVEERTSASEYLKRFKCSASTGGAFCTSMRFCASCRPAHASQWNLSSAASVSTALKPLKHVLSVLLGAISRLRSRNVSSRLVVCLEGVVV